MTPTSGTATSVGNHDESCRVTERGYPKRAPAIGAAVVHPCAAIFRINSRTTFASRNRAGRSTPVARGARQSSSASRSLGDHGRRSMPYLQTAFAASTQLVVSVHELQSNLCEPTV
jgi:hypothetical protein